MSERWHVVSSFKDTIIITYFNYNTLQTFKLQLFVFSCVYLQINCWLKVKNCVYIYCNKKTIFTSVTTLEKSLLLILIKSFVFSLTRKFRNLIKTRWWFYILHPWDANSSVVAFLASNSVKFVVHTQAWLKRLFLVSCLLVSQYLISVTTFRCLL